MYNIAAIKEAVADQRKIEVIKNLRDGTDVLDLSCAGLAEVKNIVEVAAGQATLYPVTDEVGRYQQMYRDSQERIGELSTEVDRLRAEIRQTEALVAILRSTLNLAQTTLNNLPNQDPYNY